MTTLYAPALIWNYFTKTGTSDSDSEYSDSGNEVEEQSNVDDQGFIDEIHRNPFDCHG